LAKPKTTKQSKPEDKIATAFDRLVQARLDFAHAVVAADAKGDWHDCDICTDAILETEDEYLSAYFDYLDTTGELGEGAQEQEAMPPKSGGSEAIAR
jgi:hypothetical protein